MGNLVSTYIAEYTIVIVGDDVSVRKEILQCLGEEIAQNEYISLHTNKGNKRRRRRRERHEHNHRKSLGFVYKIKTSKYRR